VKDLRRRSVTAVVYGAVVLLAVLAPPIVFWALLVLIGAAALGELARLRTGISSLLVAILFVAGLGSLGVLRALGPFDAHHALAGDLPVWLLLVLVPTWAADVAAYVAGSTIGSRKLAPRISPGKTWEGTAASLIASIVVGTLVLVYIHKILAFFAAIHFAPSVAGKVPDVYVNDVWHVVLASASINVAAQLGDLVESMLKRGANLKDSGVLLPGHGGMLDRIDALLFAAPVLWYYAGTRFIFLQ
jgi:phosphatidate cytidylyltransferase